MADETQHLEEQGPLPRTWEAVDRWLKKWGRDAVVAGAEPLTREDVERLIEANGGNPDELHLSQRDMRRVGLYGATLRRANLQGADLHEADLQGAHLEFADLQQADLCLVDLRGADLRGVKLQGASLAGANISQDTDLEGVVWDKGYISALERRGDYEAASAVYRRLKEWYRAAGMLTIAGEFHYREREASRKAQGQRIGRQFKEGLAEAWRRLRGGDVSAPTKE
jgi:hypothetical protein